ncbi:NUDIX domain-containing protein [Colwellia sp. 4_MG-2023]|uniref:NUDIX hydrolase n=1 Tax=unclassified Colwellia TaxID=196834 RepID=UPI001C081145|nr:MULTISPECIES: NUDIX domain-containing protein [unclassified Colwellia]MBU2923459.1 NUDIX domain-containing protein [Colwellia sp. C2M11]MDO6489073.1 NUDIX domain-containing protein [Colwellia sp. 6_MG-2023]MDO6508139.1 NUDIX domain-containing protein [Colwellia sp. 5_MG-2023]MDO6556837.1 NUDIX domain-containing protein [Colwellia sp. 4_MG-2023]MDO6653819.1 NUDIX domain-containing protein [Colwellia sp. 3_MG-2023]
MKKEIDKLAWLHIQDGKLLSARSKDKLLFYIPGGKREAGESDEQALIREVKEEISVDLMPDSIQYAKTFKAHADGKNTDTVVKLTCYFADFYGELAPAAEIEEIDFLDYQDKHLCSLGSIKVMDWLKSQGLLN